MDDSLVLSAVARSELVASARCFAMAAHDAIGQRRKYSGAPYWVHPQAVAEQVARVSEDETMIAAAWLHDVLEDTPVSIEELRRYFGERVAALVLDLTNVSRYGDGNRDVRKRIDREHTARAHPDAKTIKLADVIDNVTEIVEHDPGFARIYLIEKSMQLEMLREGDAGLFAEAHRLVTGGLRQLGLRYLSPVSQSRVSMKELLARVRAGESVEFDQTLAAIAEHYHYQPTAFSNGAGADEVRNSAEANQGACRVLAFARLHQLSEPQALALFGEHYRNVLADPDGLDHANIRAFMRFGWSGVKFHGQPLTPKSIR